LAGRLADGGGVGALEAAFGDGDDTPPPRQAVTFIGPIGTKNWSGALTRDLSRLLPMLAVPPVLSPSDGHVTPTIDIWHDVDESVRWRPRDGSFGESGAGGLWRERPRPADVLRAIEGLGGPDGGGDREVYLHSIVEAGRGSPGKEGGDAAPFLDGDVVRRISGGGVEPVVFPDESGTVSREDGDSALGLVARIKASLDGSGRMRLPLVVSPDLACWEAFRSSGDFVLVEDAEYAIRNGPEGCITADGRAVPAATLTTDEVNPTGAGNAFSGAYFACRAAGRDVDESSIVAGAVGAVFCEHPHMPPWSWATLRRIAEAARDIEAKLDGRNGRCVAGQRVIHTRGNHRALPASLPHSPAQSCGDRARDEDRPVRPSRYPRRDLLAQYHVLLAPGDQLRRRRGGVPPPAAPDGGGHGQGEGSHGRTAASDDGGVLVGVAARLDGAHPNQTTALPPRSVTVPTTPRLGSGASMGGSVTQNGMTFTAIIILCESGACIQGTGGPCGLWWWRRRQARGERAEAQSDALDKGDKLTSRGGFEVKSRQDFEPNLVLAKYSSCVFIPKETSWIFITKTLLHPKWTSRRPLSASSLVSLCRVHVLIILSKTNPEKTYVRRNTDVYIR
ncbi:hypothetical protein THAOC_16181, partial [Thalassiosira oceanica]